eukprot:scaffold6226_cov117-Isochrysis_galbana.AAC.4
MPSGVVTHASGKSWLEEHFLPFLLRRHMPFAKALAWLWGGGAKGVANVEVFGLGAADLADVVYCSFSNLHEHMRTLCPLDMSMVPVVAL